MPDTRLRHDVDRHQSAAAAPRIASIRTHGKSKTNFFEKDGGGLYTATDFDLSNLLQPAKAEDGERGAQRWGLAV